MKFAIITHAIHKKNTTNLYAYEPYVREMNLWLKQVDKVRIVAPISLDKVTVIDQKYEHSGISISKIPAFDTLNFINTLKSFFVIPIIIYKIFKVMFWADHIHLRCPGNVGLLGCFVQIFFPTKSKTIKYAGNWDPKSKQPFSYQLQKWIISNTFLTRNCKVLVYGKWKNQSKNIVPFFTATYTKEEIKFIPKKELSSNIQFLFVGTFSKGKQPLLAVKIAEELRLKNYNVQLNMYGFGSEFSNVELYIKEKKLEKSVFLHGNQSKEIIKKAYQKAHFLLFISKSEGWPKVVAEAMFWRCLPISTNVSCVKNMLGNGKRGSIFEANTTVNKIVFTIINLLKDEALYQQKVLEAQKWSQQFTLNMFEKEIKKLLVNE